MSRLLAALAVLLALGAPSWAEEGEASQPSLPEAQLQDLTDRQQEIFTKAENEGDALDEDALRNSVQKLAFDYDDFLKKYPDYPPAYVAYGLMLWRVDMRREAAAILTKGDGVFSQAAKKPGAETPAFKKDWALLKNELGNYVAEEGHPLDASTYYLAAIDLVPDEPLYHYQLGTLLTEAKDDFVLSGDWTEDTVEQSMHDAFKRAAELAPDRIEYVYRYAESFYDLTNPDWDEALKVWAQLATNAESEVERETMELQTANVLIKQGRPDRARLVLAQVTDSRLDNEKKKLVAQLAAEPAE